VIERPMFELAAAAAPQGILHDEPPLTGKLAGAARIEDGQLNLSRGGHVTFPNHPNFALSQPLTVECRVRFDEPGKMPVIISCGHWKQSGWFLQSLGGRWRWHVGGVDCDGGRQVVGQWTHLVGTFDGQMARLYQDGELVAQQTGSFVTAPWPGELHIGQYSGGPGPDFQVTGRIMDVRIYHRALTEDDVDE
jgi:hypothetical protein